jgi:hypothetical protein
VIDSFSLASVTSALVVRVQVEESIVLLSCFNTVR